MSSSNSTEGSTDTEATTTGSGTESDPYVITTVAELQAIQDEPDAYCELGSDINAAGTGFQPISGFGGTLDGKGYEVTDLSIDSSNDEVGLFATIQGSGTVKAVRLVDASVTGSGTVGTLAGTNLGHVEDVGATETRVHGDSNKVGGLVGQNEGTVTLSFASGPSSRRTRPVPGRSAVSSAGTRVVRSPNHWPLRRSKHRTRATWAGSWVTVTPSSRIHTRPGTSWGTRSSGASSARTTAPSNAPSRRESSVEPTSAGSPPKDPRRPTATGTRPRPDSASRPAVRPVGRRRRCRATTQTGTSPASTSSRPGPPSGTTIRSCRASTRANS